MYAVPLGSCDRQKIPSYICGKVFQFPPGDVPLLRVTYHSILVPESLQEILLFFVRLRTRLSMAIIWQKVLLFLWLSHLLAAQGFVDEPVSYSGAGFSSSCSAALETNLTRCHPVLGADAIP